MLSRSLIVVFALILGFARLPFGVDSFTTLSASTPSFSYLEQQATGLIAHWTFDEGIGTSAADSAGGRTATLQSGATWTSGHHDASVWLNGSSDYVSAAAFDVSGSALTLAAWVKHTSLNGDSDQRIIAKASGSAESAHVWMLSHVNVNGQNRLRFRLRTGNATTTLVASSGDVPVNTWYHAAATYDGQSMRLYLNGKEVGSIAKSGAIATGSSIPVAIGRSPEGSNYLAGMIDDVRIYNRALSATDLADAMAASDDTDPSDTAAPSTPAGVRASATSQTQVNVQWSASTDNVAVTGYRVRRNGSVVGTTQQLSYADTGLAASSTYSYTVAAVDAAGNESQPSTAASVTTPAATDTTAPQITNVRATAAQTSATIAWSTNEAATGQVEYGRTTSYGTSTSLTAAATSQSVQIAGLLASTTYQYRVVSRDAAGNTSRSANQTFTTSAQTAAAPSTMVGQWAFDEGSGTSAANGAGGGSATLRNATWAAGRSGRAVSLNGSSGYVEVPTVDITTSAVTLAAWVNVSAFAAGVDPRVISKATDASEQGHFWMLGLTDSGGQQRVRFRLKAGGTTTTLVASSGSLTAGTWRHIAATYDGAQMRVFLDGVQVGSVAKTGAVSASTAAAVNIGRNPDGSNYLAGAVDDVRVYRSALTAQEVSTLATGGGTPTNPDPEPTPNQNPTVSITAPASGASFTSPTTVTITASASDPENRLSSVAFYSGATLLGTDTTAPYSFTWSSVPTGTHTITAVATDANGGSATSAARTFTVTAPGATTWRVAFTASADHSTVTTYVAEVFASSANPSTATPVATSDLGKPTPGTSQEIQVDRTSFFQALAPGNYIMTVTAVGSGGSTKSTAFSFTR